ncbi:MAG: 23S rRNA (pseudouridine(1915)-N(3))-methyltransferase RlmH [Bacteroidia bacterium]|jgi:23S rRNA (pseudouridine1915-N3)-methyltransferase|nr:23S rRNA (pseudouridine(1915)-N(3))-methyltransferase RlmH [Bacteroidia bacterium]
MKVRLLTVNKTDKGWVKEGADEFVARLKKYLQFEMKDLEISRTAAKSKQKSLEEESAKILGQLKPGDYLVLLDEKGKQFTSVGFSVWLNKKFVGINGDLVFVVGGPFGFGESVRARADEIISLSEMTFTHQMVRVFFIEQLYRAMTILKNEPYHHE